MFLGDYLAGGKLERTDIRQALKEYIDIKGRNTGERGQQVRYHKEREERV